VRRATLETCDTFVEFGHCTCWPKCEPNADDDDGTDDADADDACKLCHVVHCTDADDDLCAELEHARQEVARGGSGEL
jgi:hypothetical protein